MKSKAWAKILSVIAAAALLLACVPLGIVLSAEAEESAYERILKTDGFIYGVNVPWYGGSYDNSYDVNNVLGRTSGFSIDSVKETLRNARAIGFSTVRLWMFKSLQGIQFDETGDITGLTDNFLANLKATMDVAKKNDLAVEITLQPHLDVTLNNISKATYDKYTRFLVDPAVQKNYLDKVVTPVLETLKEYKSNVLAIDVYSSPEADTYKATTSYGTTWENMATFIKATAAVSRTILPGIPVMATSATENHADIVDGTYDELGLDVIGVSNFNDYGEVVSMKDMKLQTPVILNEFASETASNNSLDFQTQTLMSVYTAAKAGGYRGAFYWMMGSRAATDAHTLIDATGGLRPAASAIHFEILSARAAIAGDDDPLDTPAMMYFTDSDNIMWMASRQADSYLLERSVSGSNKWEVAATLSPDQVTDYNNYICNYQDTGATPGSTYVYRVTAVYGDKRAVSDVSEEVEIALPVEPSEVLASGDWLTEGWNESYIRARVKIGSSSNMWNWYNSNVTGDHNHNHFEDNSQASGFSRPNYYTIVDLGRPVPLTGFVIYTDPNFPVAAFEFLGSNDGVNFTPISRTVKGNTSSEAAGWFNDGATYQYVKFQVLKPNTGDDSVNGWCGIDEIKIFGDAAAAPDPGIPDDSDLLKGLGRVNDAFTLDTARQNVDRGVDNVSGIVVTDDTQGKIQYNWFDGISAEGNKLQNNYAEINQGPQTMPVHEAYWASVDLGSKMNLSAYNVVSNDPVRSYDLYISDNGSSWTKAVEVVDNVKQNSVGKFPEGTAARYVKIVVTQLTWNGDGYNGWLSIAEVELYSPDLPESGGIVGGEASSGGTNENGGTISGNIEAIAGQTPGGSWVTESWSSDAYKAAISRPANAAVGEPSRWMDGVIYASGNSGDLQDNWCEEPDTSKWWIAINLGAKTKLTGFKMYSDSNVNDFGGEVAVAEDDGPVCDVVFYGRNSESETWTKFATLTGNTANECVATFAQAVEYQYVKFEVAKQRGMNWSNDYANKNHKWFNVAEVQLYGEAGSGDGGSSGGGGGTIEGNIEAIAGQAPTGSYLTAGWSKAEYDAKTSYENGLPVGEIHNWMDGVVYASGNSGQLQQGWFECDPKYWWVAIDLGQKETLTGFKMYSDDVTKGSENAGPVHTVSFYGRNSTGDAWTKFATLTGNTANECVATFAQEVEYRYVKFEVNQHRDMNLSDDYTNKNDKWFSLAEVQLYGGKGNIEATAGQTPTGSLVTEGWSSDDYAAAISRPENASVGEPSRWMDGIIYKSDDSGELQDNWCEEKDTSKWWIAIDLGAKKNLTGFKMYSDNNVQNFGSGDENDGPVHSVVFYGRNSESDDWEKFAVLTGNTATECVATFAQAVEYQYVKFEVTQQRGKNWTDDYTNREHKWFSVAEVQLFGE